MIKEYCWTKMTPGAEIDIRSGQPDGGKRNTEPAVICSKVSFAYAREPVIEDFSYEFREGVTLLKGYSGCGKSTLLKLIGGYLKPSGGTISLPAPWKKPGKPFQRQGLGYMFQHLNLLPLSSIEGNLRIIATLAGIPRREARADADRLLKKLGLEQLRRKKPGVLSGGQQQRAAIARALMNKPQVLLLDEPTSGLDDVNTEIIKDILRHSLPSGCVCIISTHDQRLETIHDELIDFNHDLSGEGRLQKMD